MNLVKLTIKFRNYNFVVNISSSNCPTAVHPNNTKICISLFFILVKEIFIVTSEKKFFLKQYYFNKKIFCKNHCAKISVIPLSIKKYAILIIKTAQKKNIFHKKPKEDFFFQFQYFHILSKRLLRIIQINSMTYLEVMDTWFSWLWSEYQINTWRRNSNIWGASSITWCKPNCDKIFSIALP